MLKTIVLNIGYFIFGHIFKILAICIVLGLLAILSDYVLILFDWNFSFKFSDPILGRFVWYSIFPFAMVYFYFVFLYFIALDLIVRLVKQNILLFLLLSIALFVYIGYRSMRDTVSFYPANNNQKFTRHMIIFFLCGCVYPYVAKYIERQFTILKEKGFLPN